MTAFHAIEEKHSILVRILSYNNNDVNNVGISSFGVRLFSLTNTHRLRQITCLRSDGGRKFSTTFVFTKLKRKKTKIDRRLKLQPTNRRQKPIVKNFPFLINVFTQLLLQFEFKSVPEKTV